MADLIFKRPVMWRDFFRRYAIFIDDRCIGHIRSGHTAHFEISAGMKRVRLRIDSFGSPEIVLPLSDQGVIVLRCVHSIVLPPAVMPRDPVKRAMSRLPANPMQYLSLEIERPREVLRNFLQAAWSAARYQIEERSPIGEKSRFGLTAGDLSVLYYACRQGDANMATSPGSANYTLWTALARVGWLSEEENLTPLPIAVAIFRFTEHGRTELLEIFANANPSPTRGR